MSLFESIRKSLKREKSSKQPKTNSLNFETLEQREMLSTTSILSELYSDTISTAGSSATMYLELKSDTTSKWVTVGIVIEAAEGSKLDPSKITVQYRDDDDDPYQDIPDWTMLSNIDGTNSSLAIFYVPAGTYKIIVGGDDGTTGAFTADVYVPGGTKDSPTSVEAYSSLLAQAGVQQMSGLWNPAMESLYRKQLGDLYSSNIAAAYPELEVSGNGGLDGADAVILSAVSNSGKVTAKVTKAEPDPEDGKLTLSSANLEVAEKTKAFGDSTAAITVTGGSSTSLKDYTVALSATYTISGGTGADLSKVELPKLVEGEDYKFEDGKFYFNPNGKFDFIPKGTTATLTLTYTATDKKDTSLKGTGTITVKIVGANDTPTVDKTNIDLTPESETLALDIWSSPWSETNEGETENHSEEFKIVIEGSEIKIGSKVIGNISDSDIGDTFQFATIGYPDGSVTFENSTFILWKGTGENRKAVGEITLSSDGKTLTYRAAGDREDSAFADLDDKELSEKITFTFTVKDNQGVTVNVDGGDRKSESTAVSVDIKVHHVADPQFALTLTETGVTEAAIVAQSTTQTTNSKVPLSAFFTLDYSDEQKQLYYSYQNLTITGKTADSKTMEIPEAILESLREALILEGYGKTDGVIELDRSYLTSAAQTFLNELEEGDVITVSFKVRVGNQEVETEYVDSPTLNILLKRSKTLILEDSELEVSQHNTEWVSSEEPAPISGGVGQSSSEFYEVTIADDFSMSYPSEVGEAVADPELEYGKHYKYEFVTDEETGEIGVVFSFNPGGLFDFLEVGQNATLRFSVDITDKINPGLTNTSTWEVVVKGEEAVPTPTFGNDISQATDEDKVLEITAEDIAESTNEDAELVFEKIRIKAEDVRLINGQTPGESAKDGEYYYIQRPTSGSATITLQSGSIVKLNAAGKLSFDPTNRTESLDPYELDEDGEPIEGTFAEETLEVIVSDISNPAAPSSTSYKEMVVTVKGLVEEAKTPTFKADSEIDLATSENRVLTIEAGDIAVGHSESPSLKFSSVEVLIADVEAINDEEPTNEDKNEAGTHYIIERPDSGSRSITLASGSVVTLYSTGEIEFDPREREDDLDPYELDDDDEPLEDTFAEEKITVVVEDTSLTENASTAAKELTILIKGVDEDAPLPTPVIDKKTEFDFDADQSLSVKAEEVASTSNTDDPELVFESISFNVADVAKFNGEEVDPETAVEGKYVFTRPSSGYSTIELVSGAKVALFADGKIEVDPAALADTLTPYDEDAETPDPDSYLDVNMSVIVKDISDPDRAASSEPGELSVRIKGVDASVPETPAPVIDEESDLVTEIDKTYEITADKVAASENTDAELVFHSIAFAEEDVAKINGADPDPEDVQGGRYVFTRPESGSTLVTLVSGTVYTLTSEGVLTLDATARKDEITEYQEDENGNPITGTYLNESFLAVVEDISVTETEPLLSEREELIVLLKGVAKEDVEDGLVVQGGPFVVGAYASPEEMSPEMLSITPTYKIDGLAPEGYVFSATAVMSATSEDGTYTESAQGIFSVNQDGTISLDPKALAELHEMMEVLEYEAIYYKITVLAETLEGESYTVDIPITVRYMLAPEVHTTTTLDGTALDSANWEFSKSTDHEIVMTINVTDANDYQRASEQWFSVSEVNLTHTQWKYGNEYTGYLAGSEVEELMDEEPFMKTIYDGVTALLAAKGTAFDYSLIQETSEEDEYTWTLTFEMNGESSDLYDFIYYGDELILHSQIVVTDNDFGGQTPINFMIVIG